MKGVRYIFGICAICVVLLLSLKIEAQPTFSRRYDMGWPNMVFNGVVAVDSGFYVHGIIANEFGKTGSLFSFFDLHGEPIWQTVRADSILEYESWTRLLHDSTTNTFITAGGLHWHDTADVFVFRYNSTGDIIDSAYFDSPYTGPVVRGATVTDDSGFAFVFQETHPANRGDISVLKIDSSLNKSWFMTYSYELRELPLGIACTNSGDIVVSGYTSNVGIVRKNYIWKVIVLELENETGSLVSEYTSTEDRLLAGGGILPVNDGYIIGAKIGTEIELTPSFNDVFWQPMVMKVDTGYSTIWETTFVTNEPFGNVRIEDIVPTGKSEFIGVGLSADTGRIQKHIGLMFKLNDAGDSLWCRMHNIINTRPTAYQHLKQIQATMDGGFIAAGEAWTSDGPEAIQSGWLINVDSHGCVVPDCHLVATEDVESADLDIRIWPNPVEGMLHVFKRDRDQLMISISDITGKMISQFETERGEGTWSVIVVDLVPGVYSITARNRAGYVWSQKFVKL